MKNLFCHFNIIFFLLIANYSFAQQPQWKFHIAFEDATGAKDTIYFIWDSTATTGMDSTLGEYTMSMPTDTFQVYMYYNWYIDSTKTYALSPDYGFQNTIFAKNYIYPIKISWDSSLFYNSSLASPVNCANMSNDYFFIFGGVCNEFNMLETDTVTAPWYSWGSQEQFPLYISINNYGYCCVNGIAENESKKNIFILFPNPTQNILTIKSDFLSIKKIVIFSIMGNMIIEYQNEKPNTEFKISLQSLKQGIYIIEITNLQNKKYYEKIIKY